MTNVSPELTPPGASQPEHLRIFFGADGLRAAWSLLIAVALFLLLSPAVSSLLRSTGLLPSRLAQHSPGPFFIFANETVPFLITVLITWIMARLEGRPISVYGLGGHRKLANLVFGVLTGLIAISLLVFILLKAGLLIVDRSLLSGSQAVLYAILWIPAFLAIAFFEEYLFRGYLQYTLARGLSGLAQHLSFSRNPRALGFWTAAVLVSFGFAAVHRSNPGESPLGLLCAGAASLIFCFSLWRTGSLWWAIGLHAAWDYGQSFLFGVGDSGIFVSPRLLETHPAGSPLLSGGATGPEGSIFSLVVLAVVAIVIHRAQPLGPHSYLSQMPAPHLPPDPAAASSEATT